MNIIRLLGMSVFVALAFGCSVIPTQFGGTSPLPAERHSSTAIDVARPAISIGGDGRVTVVGYVERQAAATTTAGSHVDISFLDAGGSVLREETVAFEPRELPPRLAYRSHASARYELTIAALPVTTQRVSVRAHDEPHQPNAAATRQRAVTTP